MKHSKALISLCVVAGLVLGGLVCARMVGLLGSARLIAPTSHPIVDGPEFTPDAHGTTYDLGVLKEGAPQHVLIPFSNTGSGILRLDGFTTSCGCLRVDLASSSIVVEPGKAGVLFVNVDTHFQAGRIRNYVNVRTNEISAPLRRYEILFSIAEVARVLPRDLQFGNVATGDTVTRTVAVRRAPGGEAISVGQAVADRPEITCVVERADSLDQTVVVVTLRPSARGTSESGRVYLDIEGATVTRLEVPCSWHAVPTSGQVDK
jgi:hypothetical protein